ncbi:hypothetical protein [Leifsonia xyli]|uniref:hypothetical protein n=1 Tax=Leifsonia xyli TaxID=1575 RepID=UPI003D674EB6
MPKKKNKKNLASHRGSGAGAARTWSNEEEETLYQWLLAQRILFECGQLEAEKVTYLSQGAPGWNTPVTDSEFTYALAHDHQEMNSAFEIWFNFNGLAPEPLTFEEIRVKAAMEM